MCFLVERWSGSGVTQRPEGQVEHSPATGRGEGGGGAQPGHREARGAAEEGGGREEGE